MYPKFLRHVNNIELFSLNSRKAIGFTLELFSIECRARGKTRCRRKRLTAYLPSLKLFLPLPSVKKFAKQANLASHRVFVRVFLLCSSWMCFLMGLSKAINLFELCLWFMAHFGENLSKLVETLQTSVNED